MKYFSYLNTATEIISSYTGEQPFHLFIKDFFRQHKKYGSTDRKQITHLCYCYFRLGKSLQHTALTEKILMAVFLCSDQQSELLAQVKPAWNDKMNGTADQKLAFLNIRPSEIDIFPAAEEISSSISKPDFIFSHLIQPDVFLRIRPG